MDDAQNVNAFLSHPECIRLLSQCPDPFSPPSHKSKSDFESKTAAIHVETSHGLREIKADALWLSHEAGIDEIAALRITVLESQNRSATRLLSSFSTEEISSVQSAGDVDKFRLSSAGPSFTRDWEERPGMEEAKFNSEESRRLRLRALYLSERSHILKTARKLLAFSLRDSVPNTASRLNEQHGSDRDVPLHDLGTRIFGNRSSGEEWHRCINGCIEAIRSRLSELTGGGGWLGASESNIDVECLWRTTMVEEVAHILQFIFLELQATSTIPTAALLLSWLRLMSDCNFLETLQVVSGPFHPSSLLFFLLGSLKLMCCIIKPCPEPADLLLSLRVLASATSVAFLKLSCTIPLLINRAELESRDPSHVPYFLSTTEVSQINEIFLDASQTSKIAIPAAFSWGLVLYTMQELALSDRENLELEQLHSAVDSFQSNTPSAAPARSERSLYEEPLDSARTSQFTADEAVAILSDDAMKVCAFDIVSAIASNASKISAVDDVLTDRWIRVALLDLVRIAVIYVDYSTEILQAALAILSGSDPSNSWHSHLSPTPTTASDPRYVFAKDVELMDKIFNVARGRFPYETVPFLKLCRALTCESLVNEDGLPIVIDELENASTFTQMVSPYFQGYETIREDENANLVSLVQPLPMLGSSRSQPRQNITSSALIVTSSSEIPVSTIGEVVSEMRPAVIMWQHEYSCLSYLGSRLDELSAAKASPEWDDDAVTEIIMLLSELIASAKDGPQLNGSDSSAKRILEAASDGLDQQHDIISIIYDIFERNIQDIAPRTGEGTLDSTIACLQFIRNLTTVLPHRVWPLLSRSSLLGSDGQGGTMTAIVTALEVTSGDYPFLLNCIELFRRVVDDAASHAVMRKTLGGVLSKSTVMSDLSAGVPTHVMRVALLNFVRAMVDVFDSNVNWRFDDPEQRFRINTALATTFGRILYYTYGTDSTANLDTKVTGVFSASARYLTNVLRPRSASDLSFSPILRLIMDGLQTPPTLYMQRFTLIKGQVKSMLDLSSKLVQIARLVECPASLLDDQLFKSTPILVKLYAVDDEYRLPVLMLLDILVSSTATDAANEPPSLFGHLGADSSRLFLDLLAQFDKPFGDRPLLRAIWHLLSAFVSKRQQWIAVYILTGSSPREALKAGVEMASEKRGIPFLQTALDTLSHIEQVEPQAALATLQFVSQAQENWHWTSLELRKHPHFMANIVNHLSKLNIASLPVIDQIFATRIAAVVADLCAVYLYYAKESKDMTFFKTLMPLVFWYTKGAVDVAGYNASLHTNMKKNFEMRFPGCKLVDFKGTSLLPRSLGRDYYYDTEFAKKLLSYDFSWAGNRNQGFAEEFERANINLSLVEAQLVSDIPQLKIEPFETA